MGLLGVGAFVRVSDTSLDRAGQDGMVVAPSDGETVGLLFGYDRYARAPEQIGVVCTGLVESWKLDDLDLSSIEH